MEVDAVQVGHYYPHHPTKSTMAVMYPPGGLLEIVFSFDGTGSMHSYIDEVKKRLLEMIQRLQADIPGIRLAVIAHGDYCNRGDPNSYVTTSIDFSTDVTKLCDFVKGIQVVGGGDLPECYELVLYEVQHSFSWTPGSQRALVMIGDALPHEPNYPQNTMKLDWRQEIQNLAKMMVTIYSVQCGTDRKVTPFYQQLADGTAGRFLNLNNFVDIFDLLMAVCYREKGADFLQMYEKEVRARGTNIHKDLDAMFGVLKDADASTATTTTSVVPAPTAKTPSKHCTLLKRSSKSHDRKTKPPKAKRVSRKLSGGKLLVTSKCKTDKYPLLKRENVPETNFMFNNLQWSPWQLAITPAIPASQDSHFKKRRGDSRGFRRKSIYTSGTNKPSLYEFAVQTRQRGKKLVVYSKTCKGFTSRVCWESRLLRQKNVKNQIDDVIHKGCSVYVRRVLLNRRASKDSTSLLRQKYDYAWMSVRKARSGHRAVVKSQVQISTEGL